MLDAQQLVKIVEPATALFGTSAVLMKTYVLQLQHLEAEPQSSVFTRHVCLLQQQQPTLIKHSSPKSAISAYSSQHCLLGLAATMPQSFAVNHCLVVS